MRIDRFLSKSRILELSTRELSVALDEMLAVSLPAGTSVEKRDALRVALIESEAQMQRRVGEWAAIPSIRTPLVSSTIITVGRLPAVDAGKTAAPSVPGVPASKEIARPSLRVVFLVLAPEHGRNYHAVLSSLVHELEDEDSAALIKAGGIKDFRQVVMSVFMGAAKVSARQDSRWNLRFAGTAARLAESTKCQVLLFFADTFGAPVQWRGMKKTSFRTIFVSGTNANFSFAEGGKPDVINVNSFSAHRMSQLRAALFVGLMRGNIRPTDRICCLGGMDGSDKLDSLIVIEAAQEFPSFMMSHADALVPAHVRPEVLERAIAIVTELATEGREGKPVGTIMVIGDLEKITPYTEQLVLNPFSGYRAEDRNILNPFVEETIKEWALIDGAFVVDGEGRVHSAGSRLTAVDSQVSLQGGLGTRHAAAAAISSVADCAALCVSSSGQVTLFRHGESIVLLERSVSRTV